MFFIYRFLQDSLPNLNDYPVYLGQPPSYVSSQKSANGYLWGASTFTGALAAEQVKKNAYLSFVVKSPNNLSEEKNKVASRAAAIVPLEQCRLVQCGQPRSLSK